MRAYQPIADDRTAHPSSREYLSIGIDQYQPIGQTRQGRGHCTMLKNVVLRIEGISILLRLLFHARFRYTLITATMANIPFVVFPGWEDRTKEGSYWVEGAPSLNAKAQQVLGDHVKLPRERWLEHVTKIVCSRPAYQSS